MLATVISTPIPINTKRVALPTPAVAVARADIIGSDSLFVDACRPRGWPNILLASACLAHAAAASQAGGRRRRMKWLGGIAAIAIRPIMLPRVA